MALIVIGGLGFVVWNDLMAYRKTRVLLLHTKIVLMVTIFLILFGALGYLGLEWDNEKTMQALDMKGKIGAASCSRSPCERRALIQSTCTR